MQKQNERAIERSGAHERSEQCGASERVSGASERASGASERASGRASGPVLTSRLQADLNHRGWAEIVIRRRIFLAHQLTYFTQLYQNNLKKRKSAEKQGDLP